MLAKILHGVSLMACLEISLKRKPCGHFLKYHVILTEVMFISRGTFPTLSWASIE
jgi:hypothetical protein